MRQRLFLPALSMVMVVTSLVSSLGTPLVPMMVEHFGVTLEAAQWVLTMPMLTAAVLSPLIGRLGAPGRQRALILGCLVLVSLGLLLSMLPLGFVAMLIGRGMQGVGLALAPVVMALARSVLGREASLPAIANLSAAVVIAASLSYPLSSIIASFWGIPGAYAAGFALSAVTLLLAWYAIPGEAPEGRVVIDWPGVALLAAGSGALLLLLSSVHTWNGLLSAGTGLFAAVLVLLWTLRSLRVVEPLIDLRLASTPQVRLAHVVMALSSTGSYMLLPLIMLSGQDGDAAALPLVVAGFLLVPYSVTSAIAMRAGNALRGKVSLRGLLMLGTLLYVLSGALLAFAHSSLWALLLGAAIGGIGGGWTFSVLPQLIVQQVPRMATASALSFNTLVRYVGNGAGIALCPVFIALGDGGYALAFLATASLFLGSLLVLLVSRRERR